MTKSFASPLKAHQLRRVDLRRGGHLGGLCSIVKHKRDQRFAAVNGSGQLGAGKAVVQRIAVRNQLPQIVVIRDIDRDFHNSRCFFTPVTGSFS